MSEDDFVPVRGFWDILNSSEWLGDEHIARFEGLLRSKTMYEPRGCVMKVLLNEIRPIPRDRDHIEILHSGDNIQTGHYTCFYYCCDEDRIYVFDSGQGRFLTDDQKKYIEALLPAFPYKERPIIFGDVDYQVGGFNCGLCAMAFAVALVFGVRPDRTANSGKLYLDHSQLRNHLKRMFETNELIPFPQNRYKAQISFIKTLEEVNEEQRVKLQERSKKPPISIVVQKPPVAVTKALPTSKLSRTDVQPEQSTSISQTKVDETKSRSESSQLTSGVSTTDKISQFNGILKTHTVYQPQGVALIDTPDQIKPLDCYKKHIEILHSNLDTDDCICVFIDVQRIYVFDPSMRNSIRPEQLIYLKKLLPSYSFQKKSIIFSEVDSSRNVKDSVYFSMAYATSLAFGRRPDNPKIYFDHEQLSEHLAKILREGTLTPFPQNKCKLVRIFNKSLKQVFTNDMDAQRKRIAKERAVFDENKLQSQNSQENSSQQNILTPKNCLSQTIADIAFEEQQFVTQFEELLRKNTKYNPRGHDENWSTETISSVQKYEKHIELIHVSSKDCNDHWACLFYDLKSIIVYDPVSGTTSPTDCAVYIDTLFEEFSSNEKPKVQFPKFSTRCSVEDSLYYAIALATSLAFGLKKEILNIHYDNKIMRGHLLQMLQSEALDHFPLSESTAGKILIPILKIVVAKEANALRMRKAKRKTDISIDSDSPPKKKSHKNKCLSPTHSMNQHSQSGNANNQPNRVKEVKVNAATDKTSLKRPLAENAKSSNNHDTVKVQKIIPVDTVDLTSALSGDEFAGPNFIGNGILTQVDTDRIVEGRMLSDIHMEKFNDLLRKCSDFAMQSTLLINSPARIKPVTEGTKNLQILHNSTDSHWICSYYDGEKIKMYDSMFREKNRTDLPEEYAIFLSRLYPFLFRQGTMEPLEPILWPTVDQQAPNSLDCGPLAIIYAIEIALGGDPENIKYQQQGMRDRLLHMYESQVLELIPRSSSLLADLDRHDNDGDCEQEFHCNSSDEDIEEEKVTKRDTYSIRLKTTKEAYKTNLFPLLSDHSEVERKMSAERIINLCFYERNKLINQMRGKLTLLGKKALVHLEREASCNAFDFESSLEALCGEPSHSCHKEAYFHATTYKPVDSSKVLEINSNGAVNNTIEPTRGEGKKNIIWACCEECNVRPEDLTLYKEFLQMLVDCQLSKIPALADSYECTVKVDKSKKGHTEACMEDPSICKSKFVILHKLAPHFKNIRSIQDIVYKLLRCNNSLLEVYTGLESLNEKNPDISILLKTADAVEARGVTMKKYRDIHDNLDEAKLRENHPNALKDFTVIDSDHPRLPCISCQRLLCQREVHRYANLRKSIDSEAWRTFSNFIGIPDYSHLDQEELEMYLFMVDEGYEEEEESVIKSDTVICKYCLKKFRDEGVMPPTCVYNKMDPGEIPEVIKDLQTCELFLIKRAKAFHTIVRMGTVGGKNQNYQQDKIKKVKGRTFQLPIDTDKIIEKIVPANEALNLANTLYILVASTANKLNLVYEDLVNVAKVILALRWLKDHNRHYAQINIPPTVDGLLDNMPSNIIYESDENDEGTDDIGVRQKSEIHDAILTQIHDTIEFSEKYTIRPLHNKNIDRTTTELYQMKKIDEAPLDNRHKHLDELCFPELYPLGINGLKDNRLWPISDFEFVKRQMMSKDPRFRRNHDYMFYLHHQQNIRAILSGIYFMMNVVNQKYKITAGELKEKIFTRELEQNLNAVLRRVRGTDQFFKQAKSHIHCMSKYYGPCTFFLTFSPSDWAWDDLKQYLLDVNSDDPKYASMTLKQLIAVDPISTSRFVENKFQATLKFLLSDDHPIGKVKHYFWRREYQNRGLQHFHLLIWNDEAPALGIDSNEKVMEYIQRYMTCRIPDETSPILRERVIKNQTHKHGKYCMRTVKHNSGKMKRVCRFSFPRPPTDEMVIRDVITSTAARRKLQSGKRLYDLPRSEKEQWINDYNPPLALVWNGNMDIQFVQDGECNALIMYLSKYCTKSEISHIDDAIFKDLESKVVFTNLFRLAMKAMDHRDAGLMEVADAVLGNSLWGKDSLSTIRYLNINEHRNKKLKDKREIEQLDDESTDLFCESLIDDHYPNRPRELADTCLFDFATWYDIHKEAPKRANIEYYKMGNKFAWKRQNRYLISHYEYNVETYPEAFYHTLLLLFQPWRDTNELKNGCETYAESFSKVSHQLQSAEDYKNKLTLLEKGRQEMEKFVLEKMTEMEAEEEEDPNMIDFAAKEVEDAMNEFQAMVQHDSGGDLQSMITMLNSDQKRVFDHVTRVLREQIEKPSDNPELLRHYVSGEGGTGKSFLIAVIKKYIREVLGKDTAVSAPTGVAARNVSGMTIHKLLQLPIDKDGTPEYRELSNETAKVIRDQCENTLLFIFDEVSMISNVTIAFIHLRLKQVFGVDDDWFGMKNVLCFGDLLQLPPVQEDPVFCKINKKTMTKCFRSLGSYNIWELITYDELNINMRQKTDSEYAEILSRVRLGYVTQSDIAKLSTRLIDIDINATTSVRLDQICDYSDQLPADSVCLLPTNVMCDTMNQTMLDRIKSDEIKLTAQDSIECPPRLKQSVMKKMKTLNKKPRNTGGLSEEITVKIGCKLMIRRNIDVTNGLVNGTLGKLVSVSEENGHVKSVKLLIENGKEVKIERVKVKFHVFGNIYAIRFQFPLSLAWALTVHKAQGLSLTNVMLDCGNSIFAYGQAYVGLSRVTTLNGLHLINFSPSVIKASADAIVEYNRLKVKFKQGANCIEVPEDRCILRVPDRRWLTNMNMLHEDPNDDAYLMNIQGLKGLEKRDEAPCINAVLQCLIHTPSIFTHLLNDSTTTDALTDLARSYQTQKGPFNSLPLAQSIAATLAIIDFSESPVDAISQVFIALCGLQSNIQHLVVNTIVQTIMCTKCKYSTTDNLETPVLNFSVLETKSVKLQALIQSIFEHWKRETIEMDCTHCNDSTSYISKRKIKELSRILVVQLSIPPKQNVNITGASDIPLLILGKKYKVISAVLYDETTKKFSAIIRKDKTFWLIDDLTIRSTRWPRGSKPVKLLVLEQIIK